MPALNSIYETQYGEQTNVMQFFPPAPQWIDQVSTTGGTSSTYTIPAGAVYLIVSSPSEDYWLKVDGAAVVPVAGITDGTGSFLNLSQLNVRGVTSIGIITSGSAYITIAAYK